MTSLAPIVRAQGEHLIRRWEARVRERLAESGELAATTEPEQRDHMPGFLGELGDALQRGTAPDHSAAAVQHGRQRYRLGFDVAMMLREYGIMRDVIFDEIEHTRAAVTLSELRILTDFFSNAIAEAVTEYDRERMKTEHALRTAAEAERARQHDLFMQAPVAIAILDGPQHVFTFANPAYRALVNGREVVGLPLLEVMPDVADQGFDAVLDRVMASGEAFSGKEIRIVLEHHADGEALILNFVYTPKRNLDGIIDGVLMTGWDVTDVVVARERVEVLAASVLAREAELRLVTDALPFLISFVTPDERYGLVNRTYEDWFGQPAKDLLGRQIRDVIGEPAYAVLAPYVRRGLAGERFSFEQRGVPYRHGGTRDVRGTFVPRRDPTGAVQGYVGMLEDVTERLRLEEERERFARQRTEVLDSMGDAFFALDAGWRFTQLNRNFERRASLDRANALGRELWQVFPDAETSASSYVASYRRCMAERIEVQLINHEPALDRWTDVRVYPTGDGGISVFLRDVSAENRARIDLQRRAEFEQQLIGIVSHDLRNPLNVVQLSVRMLLEAGDLGAGVVKNLGRIENAAERASRLVRDLLDFTQARFGGGLQIDPRPADVHAIVRGVVEEVEASFPGRRIELHQAGEGAGTWDPDRLAQVIQNLATNALKYSPADGLVTITSRGEAAEVILCVHNGGAPIPADKLARLFEPYQRATAQLDSTSRSVGLGLYIVKQLVEAHHGTVDLRSTAGDGTTFTVRLPRG